MKKITALILAMAMLITANCVLAESDGDAGSSAYPPEKNTFAWIESDSIRRYDRTEFILVTKSDGRYLRSETYLDPEGERLYDNWQSGTDPDAEKKFMAYAEALPASFTDELDVVPPAQEELDALAGKTLGELRSALPDRGTKFMFYYHPLYEAYDPAWEGEITFTVESGFFRYDVTVRESHEEYRTCGEKGGYDSLTVKSITLEGLSANAAEPYWISEGIRKAWKNAGSEGIPPFRTVREAFNAGDSFRYSSSGNEVVMAMEIGGRYFRYAADLGDESERKDAYDSFGRYTGTLPITRAEELTAVPLTQQELDALAGKTLGELKADFSVLGPEFHYYPNPMGTGEIKTFFRLDCGIFAYTVEINEPYEEYLACKEAGDYSPLTVKSAARDGLSSHAAEPDYRADGTREPDRFATFEVYNRTGENITEVAFCSADGSNRLSTNPGPEDSGQGKYPIMNMTTNLRLSPVDRIIWTTESGSTTMFALFPEEGKYIITLLPAEEGLIEIKADGPADRPED